MKIKIKFLIVTVFISLNLTSRLSAQQHWSVVSSPTPNNLRNIFFTDTLHGWIGGDSGTIIHTTNNGKVWNLQNSGVNNYITSIFFTDNNTGYAMSWNFDKTPPYFYGTFILSTTNSGNTWSKYLFRDTNVFLNSIYFTDSQNGCMAGTGGKLYYTSNGGTEWLASSIDSALVTGFPIEKIKFSDSNTGYAAGGAFDIAGMIWKTTNAGRNWKSSIVGPEPLNDIYIFNSDNIITVGGDYEYGASSVTTSNGGLNWNYREFGVFGISRAIDFRTQNEGWIPLGITDSFLVTTNSGINWNLTGTPQGSKIFGIIFTDTNKGWAVGDDGIILKYNSNIVSVTNSDISIPERFSLSQNYPNPFNPTTKINYKLPASRQGGQITNYVSLKIYDVLGNEVITLVNQKQNVGSYVVEFDGSNLPSGIYFVKLFTYSGVTDVNPQYSISRKMLLLK